jgi:hypothetical protein
MIDGTYTAFIDDVDEKYRITVKFVKAGGGVLDFIVGITNYTNDYKILSRYTDFQLEYSKNGNTYGYEKALN